MMTWADLGYNNFLTRSLEDPTDFQTASDYNANVQDGSITNAKIKDLTANKVVAGTMTGATIQTSDSGERLVMSGDDNSFYVYSSLDKIRVSLGGGQLDFYDTAGASAGSLIGGTGRVNVLGGALNILSGLWSDGVTGKDGTFTTTDGKTVTVSQGVITSIV